MREGIGKDGEHLYPAFPYDRFQRTTDEDIAALYAFVMSLPPVRAETPANKLVFPFNVRGGLALWKRLHFNPAQRGQTTPGVLSYGEYLVEGLGHCGSCHSPRTRLFGEDLQRVYDGGEAEGWHAYAIDENNGAPIPWDTKSLAFYLRHGWHPQHGIARGTMGLVTDDLAAAAVTAATRRVVDDRAGVALIGHLDRRRHAVGRPAARVEHRARRREPAQRRERDPPRDSARAGRRDHADDAGLRRRARRCSGGVPGPLDAREPHRPAAVARRAQVNRGIPQDDAVYAPLPPGRNSLRSSEDPMTTIELNGSAVTIDAEADTPLLYVLRGDLQLNGAKFGCGLGQCGACTVLVEGEAVFSCTVPIGVLGGKKVTTLEGLGTIERPGRVQRAFIEEQAAQCGYCIPGFIMRAEALLRRTPNPTDAQIREALQPNLCRCGTHMRIFRAVRRAAKA